MSDIRVLAETAYPRMAPSARVRIDDFVPSLRQQGVALDYRPALTDEEYRVVQSHTPTWRKLAILARSARRMATVVRLPHDLLLVHRLRLLSPLPGVDPPRRLDVYDLDDALFLSSAAHVNRRFAWVKQEPRRCLACLRRARLVTAGNAYLADHARQYASRVEIVPTCVDATSQPRREHAESDEPVVGWIGSQSTGEYLREVIPAFLALRDRGVRFRLVIVGADIGVREPWIEYRRWSHERQRHDLAGFDVGVMPLPSTDWARGKCGYKLLQYFAAGVPAVASPVGVSRDLVGGERGFLASGKDDWVESLRRLVSDVDERRSRGEAARAYVEREYSYERWAPELAALYRSLVA